MDFKELMDRREWPEKKIVIESVPWHEDDPILEKFISDSETAVKKWDELGEFKKWDCTKQD